MNNIYCDGACCMKKFQENCASWSFLVTDDKHNVIQASVGPVLGIQNVNRAELQSFIKALEYAALNTKENYIIHTDYEALYLYIKGKATPKANLDLYSHIDKLLLKNNLIKRILISKVKAHQDEYNNPSADIYNVFNNAVDTIANQSSKFFKFNNNNYNNNKEEILCQN